MRPKIEDFEEGIPLFFLHNAQKKELNYTLDARSLTAH